MKRAFGKILSLILVVAMLIQIFPTAVFATENKEVSLESFSELAQTRQETVEEALSSAQILFEEESLREHNVKHFRMDDGNYIAVQYGTPVHYEDDGEWVDYDNTLYPVNSLDGSGVSCYRVVNGDSTRVFATNADAKYLLAVQKGDYSLAFAPVQEAAVELPIDPNQPIVASTITEEVVSATVLDFASTGDLTDDLLLEQVQPDKLYSALEYSNAMHGADLRYENYGNTIKESIVISAPQTEYTYSFDIETEGLAATLQSDGSVLFTSTDGTIVYYIPAPYMVDANNEYSYEASYTLTGSGSTFTLTVTADASWINAENRAFPVILDPTIVEQDLSDSVMSGGFVRSGYPDSVDPRETGLYVGDNGNNNADTRTYLHVNSLIDLPEGCEMYYAGFAMYHYAHEYKSGGSDLEVGLYGMAKVNGATSSSMTTTQWRTYIAGLTWSDVISSTGSNYHDADHLSDKKTLNTSTVGDYVTWDLTTLAYNWYDGDNLGFALIPINESSASSRATFYGPRKTEYQPMLFLAYKSTVGIESYYTYQSANIGRAGTSYISDYSMQNTLVVPLISSASDVMPFSLSMVYNSAYGARAFTNDDTMLHTKDFSTMKLGTGWKLSAQESVVKITLNDETYLVYTDSDGTEHYFKYDSEIGKYTDEDGLGLYLTISGTNFTMTDDYENTKYFANGYLTWQKDYYGNYIYYNYNSNDQISTIKRLNKGGSAESLVTFTYDSNNRLTAITDDANRVTSFGYSTIQNTLCLTSIEFPDDAEAEYSYFDSTTFYKKARMKSAYDSDANYGIEYSYSYNKDVRNFYEYYLDGTTPVYGSKQHGYKAAHSQAIYRYYGDDQTAETSDDILTYIVLDSAGRNIGSYSTDYSKQHILGVGAAGYTTNSGTSKKNNRLTASVSAGQQGVNMLKNGNLETGSSSTTVTSWSRSSSTYVKVGTTAYTGDRGAYFSRSTATSTKDRLYQSSITLKANRTYTFSAYIKVPDTVVFSDGGGIYLSLRNSSTEYATSEIIDYSTEKINDGWIRLTTTYTVGDTDLTSIMATVYATYYKGMMYVDALQLEEEDAASTFNMAEEGSFENTTSFATSATSGWYMAGAAQLTTEGGSYFGSKAVALSGSGYQRVSQSIPVNAPLGSTFILSAWAKGAADPDSVEKKTVESDPYFGLVLRFYFSDDTSEVHYYPFDTYYRGWQYKQAIAAPEKTGSVTIDSITIVVAYDNNINTAYVDNVSFRMEPVQTYTYNSDGKLTATTQMGTGSDSAEYTGVDLTQYTSANNNKYTYTYNDAHDVLTASAGGVTATNSYNASGNVVGSTLKNSAGSLIISTSNTITSDFNHIKSSTDGNGDTTTYTYDSDTEQLTSVKNAKNILTEYEYDSAGRMKKVSQVNQDDTSKNDVTVNYIYKNGQIETLGRTTKNSAGRNVYQGYNFESNQWGQNTAINIATSSNGTTWTEAIELISYAYENYAENASGTGGGNLAQTTFGNDDTINYTYDEFDRLIGMMYNSGKYVTYTYNSEGSVAEMEYGNSSGKQGFYRFEYDSLGRLIRSAELDGDDNLVQRTEHIYDSYNRLSSQSWTVGTETYTESYTYSDGENGNGSISHITTATGASVSFAYDTLQRLNKKTVKNGTATIYTSAYSFYTSGATTTTQIEYHNIKDANNNVLTGGRYVYDSLGNIEKIYESVLVGTNTSRRQLAAYEYDAQNQLTKETIYTYAKTNLTSTPTTTTIYEYTYDTAGNILSESKTVGNSTTTKSYTYDNANWKDLLTGVNGMEITYDEIGNPVSYRNGTELYYDFEWENGRELSFVEYYHGDQGRAFYYYDADGIRIKKVLDTPGDCPTVNYVTQNGKVVRETLTERYGTKVLDYIYDDTGKPFALIFTDADSTESTYYYALNLQGDVVGLLNESGSLVVKYRYNAWGEILSITDGEDVVITDWYHIAHLNPLRYRGYYYDTETGFYYLQSRYYDPANHRFINADDAEYSTMSAYSTNDTNLFTYCGNNPVNRADDGGQFWNFVIGAVVGAVVSAAITIVDSVTNGEGIDWADVAVSAATGAVNGAIAASGMGALAQAGVTAATSLVGNVVQQGVDIYQGDRDSFSIGEAIGAGATGFATSIIGSAAGKLASGKMLERGSQLISKGRANALTGQLRKIAGQGHSSLIRHANKAIATGTKLVNTAQGISSVVGTIVTIRENALFAAAT